MPPSHRAALLAAMLILTALTAGNAAAQVDFTGVWQPQLADEDSPERGPGPALVDFVGLPINDYARQWGLAYRPGRLDRKSTRLNSSHVKISYAVFCLKKK